MADSNLLASIIAGQDPLSPQMLQGQQGAQLSQAAIDPNFAHNSGPFGVLASLIAGTRGHDMLQNSVQNTTQARMGAAPDLARLLAQPDPYQAAAANPEGYNPIALAHLVNGSSPLQAAQTREAAANAALAGLNVSGFSNLQGAQPAQAAVGIAAPASRTLAPPVQLPGNARYVPPQASGTSGGGAAGGADPLAVAMTLPPQQRAAIMQNPNIRARYIQLLQARMQAQSAAAPPVGGGGNALRPPT